MIGESKFYENIASLKLMAKKEVGQNFLIEPEICRRIAEALEAKEGERVLEIGCGPGSLSYALASLPCESDLIDIDEGMLAKGEDDFENVPNLHPMYGNAIKWDYAPYDRIIGNLPYYITSGILERCFLGQEKAKRMVFMVQKEAAQRLLAPVGTKEYSPLSVLLALSAKPKRLFSVSRNAFVPAPHVDSAVISFDIHLLAEKSEIVEAYRLATGLFLQRRKTVLNNLKPRVPSLEKAELALASAGIDPKARPEDIKPEQFLLLSRALKRVQ